MYTFIDYIFGDIKKEKKTYSTTAFQVNGIRVCAIDSQLHHVLLLNIHR